MSDGDPLRYRSGSPAGRLDPRPKLAVQAAFVAAAFVHTTPQGLAVLTAVALVVARAARLPPLRALWAYRAFVPFLLAGPLLAALSAAPPWVRPAEAVTPALASYRVLVVFLVAGAYLRSTPARETRAAVQWLLPGRLGRRAGVGIALAVRFLPTLRADLRRARDAADGRLAARRPLHERMRIVATAGLRRVFGRAEAASTAMRARCFAWTPTPPTLRLGAVDVPALALAAALAVAALAPVARNLTGA